MARNVTLPAVLRESDGTRFSYIYMDYPLQTNRTTLGTGKMALYFGRLLACIAGALSIAATATAADRVSPRLADTIHMGRIITMAATPTDISPVVQAVAVADGRIIAVGTRTDVLRHRGANTQVIELGNKTLLPGFIDAHGHLTATASTLSIVDLSAPPVGEVRTIADAQAALRRYISERRVPPGAFVVGFGYDDAQLAEKRHPDRDDLDAVSTEHPILISHVSGHLAATNTLMLAVAGMNADSPDPEGGVIRRRPGSREPDGVLEETAFNAARAKIPPPDLEQSLEHLVQALRYYARMGITSVQDGALMGPTKALLDEAARRELLKLDVVTYQLWSPIALDLGRFSNSKSYDKGLKHYGIKLILDGSPQGKTAFLSQPYRVPPAGQKKDYVGYPTLPAETIQRAVRESAARGIPVLAHANGDAAAQILIDAVALAKRDTPSSNPDVTMIHAQTVRDDQLDRMKDLGIRASFFVGHTFYWGDWHREETLGPIRADRISPTRSAIERKVPFTLHTDTPVVPPDMIKTLWSATTRRSRSGDILGPAQRLTVSEALAGITIEAARQQGDESIKGSIEVGKQADFVVLSGDPLTTDPENLRDLQVVETIARGRRVWP